jgi:hypothetical protein
VLDEKFGDKVYKLRSEEHVWPLFFLHMLANTGGLVAGGQSRIWKVTPEGNVFFERHCTDPTWLYAGCLVAF